MPVTVLRQGEPGTSQYVLYMEAHWLQWEQVWRMEGIYKDNNNIHNCEAGR